MLSIHHLTLQYGDKHLFRDINAQIHAQDKIGLAGVNGAGKTTLLKMITGEQESDPGVINRAGHFTIAYLPQEVTSKLTDRSLYEEAESAFGDLLAQQAALETLNQRLADIQPDDPEMDQLITQQGNLQHALEGADLFRIRPRVEQVLRGLGFRNADLEKSVLGFSGGWLMRLLLAKLLLQQPNLILLDEPTNHLDLDSLTWLEDFLSQYQGALLIISHDRIFLDKVTNKTWELSLGRLATYKGNYSHYLVEKEQRRELELAAWGNQQAKIKQTERFIERFKAKSAKAKQAQSRAKQLEKMERIEISETDKTINFRFPPATSSGRDVLTLDKVSKDFADQPVFKEIQLALQRGDKLGIVGVNGAGKTTLLKIIAALENHEGEVKLGHNVVLSYFGQHQAQELAGDLSILDTVYHNAEALSITQTRALLGAFLFTGDAVDKKVKVLSGGEKSRVALAKMLVRPANLMLLDEPTNHLDITSQEVLQRAMAQYEGGIIVVSHNRAFVNAFVNKVLEIKNHRATLFEGNIDDYLEKRAQATGQQTAKIVVTPAKKSVPKKKQQTGESEADKKAQRRERAQQRQQLNEQLKPWRNKANHAEKALVPLEARQEELEAMMADTSLYSDRAAWHKVENEYNEIKRQIEQQYQRWESAQEKIDHLSQLAADET